MSQVRLHLVTLASLVGVLVQVPTILLLVQLSANAPRKAVSVAQVLGPLPPMRETRMGFLTPGFSLG